ncbi:hypothetical protein QZH41_018548 [Actinostola sp. cb2023]|nr:hypothetical protein QZH41_018548 [Actinostola sp. cb2023]
MVSQVEILSDREKELLANYDSRLYGFLRQHDPIGDPALPNLNHRSLLLKGVVYFEKELQEKGKAAHPAIFCKLGHLHLLTEDFPKALSAYQKFYNLPNVDYWKDAPFLYGIGLVYFSFSAYQWAIKVFQQVLYLDPGFSCSNEVHLRLGIIYKAQNNHEASIKHFHMALMDSNPCSLSKEEIHFHLGHLFEMQNKCQEAQEMYETIINSPGLPNTVKANAYKLLGWMYYNKDHLGDRASRMQKAVQLLQKAIETDPNNGSSWYLIGRCYAMQGKVHDAFTSYRHAIDKSEANADTWCSIGVLYQQQNQPMDALQAYVCAIQLDPTHVAAWTDLGILYEACDQPSDAVMCYNAAKKYGATDSAIDARVKALQAQQAMLATSMGNLKKNIPSVGEAWKLPIPAELTTRTMRNAQVESRKDAFSPALQNFCLSSAQPVTVVRGLAAALKLDLSLFSTKTLVECNGDHQVEVRTQRQQASDENWDTSGENKVWLCGSSRSFTTISKYAQYQANTFQESLKEEQERVMRGSEPMQSDSDSSSSSKSRKSIRGNKFKWIKFGTNVDLSDERKWKIQLQELNKLPPFTRVVAPSNMLSHFGHTILGMNSVQLYMKIPGSRTPGHQENNCFCAVNINIGPGDCEWFATPTEYWGVIHNLCEKYSINFLTGSWWPVLEELYEERVPVYRFIQRPGDMVWCVLSTGDSGDMVWLNPGVVHWVQSLGWCNNIAWNVGPTTGHVFSIAVERYEWNKLQGEKSIVAMIHLTWNLAQNIRVTEKKIYEHIKRILERTLKYCQVTIENLKRTGIEIQWHGKQPDEFPHYCSQCEVEVFNLLFVLVTNNRKHQVYCQDCARKTSSTLEGFIVLNQVSVLPLELRAVVLCCAALRVLCFAVIHVL